MSVPMMPTIPPETTTQIVRPDGKLNREAVQRLLEEEGGESALLILLRDDKVDRDMVIEMLIRQQNRPYWKFKRVLMAVLESVLP
jgi:hypothetical protein